MHKTKTWLIKNGVLIAITALGLMKAPLALAQNFTPITSPTVTQLDETTDLMTILKDAGGWLLTFGGILAVLFLIYGGIIYITGGAKAEETAKKIIMNALIGIIVMALSYVIVKFALTVIGA